MRSHLRTRSKLTTLALVGGLAFAGAACAVEDDDPDTVVNEDDPDTVVTDDGGDGGEAEAEVEVEDGATDDGATDDGGDAEAEAEAES